MPHAFVHASQSNSKCARPVLARLFQESCWNSFSFVGYFQSDRSIAIGTKALGQSPVASDSTSSLTSPLGELPLACYKPSTASAAPSFKKAAKITAVMPVAPPVTAATCPQSFMVVFLEHSAKLLLTPTRPRAITRQVPSSESIRVRTNLHLLQDTQVRRQAIPSFSVLLGGDRSVWILVVSQNVLFQALRNSSLRFDGHLLD